MASSEHFGIVLRQIISLILSKQDNKRKARQHGKALLDYYRSLTIPSSLQPMFAAKLLHLASQESVGER